jgi:hypothetical protein
MFEYNILASFLYIINESVEAEERIENRKRILVRQQIK